MTVSDMRLVVLAESKALPTTSRNASPWLRSSQMAPPDSPMNSSMTASGAISTLNLIDTRLSMLAPHLRSTTSRPPPSNDDTDRVETTS